MRSTSSACFSAFCFFFSSRRRHTRCSRDWSSDVCSSDLDPSPAHAHRRNRRLLRPGIRQTPARAAIIVYRIRSEEHTSELQSRLHLVCRLLLEKKNGRAHVRTPDTVKSRMPSTALKKTDARYVY